MRTIEQLDMYFFDLETPGGILRAVMHSDIPRAGFLGSEETLLENGITIIYEERL